MEKSETTFMAEAAMKAARRSTQPPLTVGSQMRSRGTHWKTVAPRYGK